MKWFFNYNIEIPLYYKTNTKLVEHYSGLNEDKTNISSKDHTSRYFDIIAGDSPKEVVITAEGLQHALNHLCTGVLLPAGQKHDSWEKVFQMGHVQPAEKGEHGYKTKADDTDINHPDDRDVYASTSKGVSVNVADVQMLTLGEDYFKASDQAIELKLGYRYNKTFLEPYTSGLSKSVADNLWLLNYFILNKELAQTYFVPISTCRYPNQIVKIRVYPDINWGISFTIGSIDKKHKENWREALTEKKKKLIRYAKYEISGDDIHSRINKESSYIAGKNKREKEERDRKKKDLLKRLNFKLGISASYNDSVLDFSPILGKDLESLLYTVGLIKETFDGLVGNGDHAPSHAEKEKKYLASAKKSNILKGLAKLPISITVDYPAFTGGFAWNFREIATGGSVTRSYDIFLKASPLLAAEGKLDLLPLAEYIPVFGQAVKVVDIIVNAGGVHPDFFISAKGKVGFGLTLKIGEEDKYSQGRVGFEGDFKVRVEASVTVSPGVIGFIFSGGDAKSFVTSTEYRAYGETGLTGNLSSGADERGPYIDFSVNFSGLQFVAEKKIMDQKKTSSKTEKLGPYNVLGASQLLKGKKYLVEDEKNNQK